MEARFRDAPILLQFLLQLARRERDRDANRRRRCGAPRYRAKLAAPEFAADRDPTFGEALARGERERRRGPRWQLLREPLPAHPVQRHEGTGSGRDRYHSTRDRDARDRLRVRPRSRCDRLDAAVGRDALVANLLRNDSAGSADSASAALESVARSG